MINPMMVEGQIAGAWTHGIGATLYEWMRFDAEGQPQTVNYADYLLPTADCRAGDRDHPHGEPDAAQPARHQGRRPKAAPSAPPPPSSPRSRTRSRR